MPLSLISCHDASVFQEFWAQGRPNGEFVYASRSSDAAITGCSCACNPEQTEASCSGSIASLVPVPNVPACAFSYVGQEVSGAPGVNYTGIPFEYCLATCSEIRLGGPPGGCAAVSYCSDPALCIKSECRIHGHGQITTQPDIAWRHYRYDIYCNSSAPSIDPSAAPTAAPSVQPSRIPSAAPTAAPAAVPTSSPSRTPTLSPASGPTWPPTVAPSTVRPSASPTDVPHAFAEPSAPPTQTPTADPSPLLAPTAVTATAAPEPELHPPALQPAEGSETSTPVQTATDATPPTAAPTPAPPVRAAGGVQALVAGHGSAPLAAAMFAGAAGSGPSLSQLVLAVDMGCADSFGDDADVSSALHPTQLKVGGSSALGCVIAAVALTVGVAVLCFAIAAGLRRCSTARKSLLRRVRCLWAADTLGVVRFPTSALHLFGALYLGASYSSWRMVIHHDTGPRAALCIAGLTFAGLLAAAPFELARRLRAGVRPAPGAPAAGAAPRPMARLRSWPRPGPHWAARLLIGGQGDWVSTTRTCHWVRRWSAIIRSFTSAQAHRAAAVELLALWTLGLIAGARSTGSTGCGVAHTASSIVHILLLAYTVAARPYRCAKDAVAQIARSGLLALGLASYAVVYFQGRSDSPVGSAAFGAAGVTVIVSVPIDVCAAILAYCSGWREKLQKEEWGEQEEDLTLPIPMQQLPDLDEPATQLAPAYTEFVDNGSLPASSGRRQSLLPRSDSGGSSRCGSVPRSPDHEDWQQSDLLSSGHGVHPLLEGDPGCSQATHPLLPRSPSSHRAAAVLGSDSGGSESPASALASSPSAISPRQGTAQSFARFSTSGTLGGAARALTSAHDNPSPPVAGRKQRAGTRLRAVRPRGPSRASLTGMESAVSLRTQAGTPRRRTAQASTQLQLSVSSLNQEKSTEGTPKSARRTSVVSPQAGSSETVPPSQRRASEGTVLQEVSSSAMQPLPLAPTSSSARPLLSAQPAGPCLYDRRPSATVAALLGPGVSAPLLVPSPRASAGGPGVLAPGSAPRDSPQPSPSSAAGVTAAVAGSRRGSNVSDGRTLL
eukprot:TRINITY_DN37346_c0_g1_i1.p1 TRINITY_DN37346_c0_g1~~TRINITY_DN37346_c0_g1_i1.p1  ORF type:complete len:1061 (+),score=97.78 TRINITY_DN37346_c0_g1_i1:255-3437(+)